MSERKIWILSRDDAAAAWFAGVCPQCGKVGKSLGVKNDLWGVCETDKLRWCTGSNDFRCDESPEIWERNAERLAGYREVAEADYQFEDQHDGAGAELIDPATCEVFWRHERVAYEGGQPLIGRVYYARARDSKTWVAVNDLPETTCQEIWRLIDAGHYDAEDALPF